jgi:hypothetical protein
MLRYKLRTLLIVLALGPPVLAWAWVHRVPLVMSLALTLAACVLGTAIGLTLLWGMEGLLTSAAALRAWLRHATRPQRPPNSKDADEFSLSDFASKVKARRKE